MTITIALPSKGRLKEKSIAALEAAGLTLSLPKDNRSYRGDLGGIDQQQRNIGISVTAPRGLHHRPVKPAARRENPRRINEIVLGKRRVTANTALRLSRYFGTSPQFWMGLQSDYDLDIAADDLGDRLDREVRTYAGAG